MIKQTLYRPVRRARVAFYRMQSKALFLCFFLREAHIGWRKVQKRHIAAFFGKPEGLTPRPAADVQHAVTRLDEAAEEAAGENKLRTSVNACPFVFNLCIVVVPDRVRVVYISRLLPYLRYHSIALTRSQEKRIFRAKQENAAAGIEYWEGRS